MSGIDTQTFKPHSCRSASSSKARANRVSIEKFDSDYMNNLLEPLGKYSFNSFNFAAAHESATNNPVQSLAGDAPIHNVPSPEVITITNSLDTLSLNV